MKKHKKNSSLRKSYNRFYEKCLTKAKRIIPNKKKISKKIRSARKIFERLHNLPRFETFSTNICNLCDLLSDNLDGIYTKAPLSTIIAVLGGLIYLVFPIDVFADFIPVLGWIDDAAVLAYIIATEQKFEVEGIHPQRT